MNGILKTICDKIKPELEERKKKFPLGDVLARAAAAPAAPSFRNSLCTEGGNPAVIAELKKASPSAGIIRADFRPLELCAELENAGAAALSVLTERNFFLGGMEYLEGVAQKVKIPVLRKDFIFDKYQIAEARAAGASAVLLIAKALSASEYAELSGFAKTVGLDVLSEAHTESEAEMLLENGADIVGVNCRNLENFKIDFSAAERLLKFLPKGTVKVAESGVVSRETLLRARDAGADAALVGSALMSAESPAVELRKLLGAV